MPSTSSSSLSSSSSSTGDIQSPIALLEMIEEAIENASVAQAYTLGDRTVKRSSMSSLRMMRQDLLAEVEQLQGTRPLVANANFSGLN